MNNHPPLMLLGLYARIIHSTDPGIAGISGKVMLETRNVVTLSTDRGQRVIPKKISAFEFSNGGSTVRVAGSSVIGRPEERISKAV